MTTKTLFRLIQFNRYRFYVAIMVLLTNSLITYGQRNVTGYYSSNKAELGMFVTRIQLNDDFTFKYEFGGDMLCDKARGVYQLDNRSIHLQYDIPKLDSADQLRYALQANGRENRQQKLVYKNGKLFLFNPKGQLVKKHHLVRRKNQLLIWRNEVKRR